MFHAFSYQMMKEVSVMGELYPRIDVERNCLHTCQLTDMNDLFSIIPRTNIRAISGCFELSTTSATRNLEKYQWQPISIDRLQPLHPFTLIDL